MWMNEWVNEWENLGEGDWKMLSESLPNSPVEISIRCLETSKQWKHLMQAIACMIKWDKIYTMANVFLPLSNDYSVSSSIQFLSPLHPLLTTLHWTFSNTMILSSMALRVCGWGKGGEGNGCSPTLPLQSYSPLSHKWTLMQISCFLDRLSFLCWLLIPICVQEP